MAAYAKAFPFVEVNSTFYEHPDARRVAAWRSRVPVTFRFAIRAHRDVSHRQRMRATASGRASFARTARIAHQLKAVAVVVETPERLRFGPAEVEGLRDLLSSAELSCPLALEARAYRGRTLPKGLSAAMEANDVVDIVDFSIQSPRTEASIAYGRMFGLGDGNRWEFTADELAAIRDRGEATGTKPVAYTFHGVRMYKDAGRFLTFMRVGKAPPVTRRVGLKSLEEVLAEAATFPSGKADLLQEHGFRAVRPLEEREVHAHDILSRLPQRSFSSPADVIRALGGFGSPVESKL